MTAGPWDAGFKYFLNRENNLNKQLSFPIWCISLNSFPLGFWNASGLYGGSLFKCKL